MVDREDERSGTNVDQSMELEDITPLGWEARVFVVALVFSIPGALFGALIALGITSNRTGLLAAVAGGLLEADYWP